MALSTPMEAEAICHPTNVSLTGSGTYQLSFPDMNWPAFNLAQTWNNPSSQSFAFWNRAFLIANSVDASEVLASNGFPADLSSKAIVGPNANFGKGKSYGLLFTYGPSGGGTKHHHQGNFNGPLDYLGFKFSVAGQVHFGWARMRVTLGPGGYINTVATTIHLEAYGFETAPDQSIQVNANCNAASATGGSADSKISASLGALALGAGSIRTWRQK